jgi:hypothetical protein
MKIIANQNEHPDHLQLKQLLEEAKPLMLPMYPDQQKIWVAESPLAQEISRFSRSTLSITPRFALSSAEFSLKQIAKSPTHLIGGRIRHWHDCC